MTLIDSLQPALEKKLPAAFVAAFLLQTAGALFWAGSAAERLNALERAAEDDRTAIERVAVLEEDMRTVKRSLDRIETKLDRERTRSRP